MWAEHVARELGRYEDGEARLPGRSWTPTTASGS